MVWLRRPHIGRPRSPDRVMALAIAAAALLIVAGSGLLYYTTMAVNGITEARESRLMERSVERRLGRLRDDVASAAVWNDAYDRTTVRFDPAWAKSNYGDYFSEYLRHDATLIVNGGDRTIYAAVAGKTLAPPSPGALDDLARAARPLLRKVRAQTAAKISRNPKALGFDRVGAAEAAVRVGERVYLVSASTIAPEEGYAKPLAPGAGPIVLSAVEVNSGYLKALDADYGLKGAALAPADVGGRPATVLRQADGTPVAAITWRPERPGLGVILRAKWWILGSGVLVLAIVALVIWRLRQVAAELAAARDRAQAGDRAKSEFIANMSHEIRTPLNGVMGMAQAMANHSLPPDQAERLKVIQDSGAALLSVLNDVLDLAKIEAGKLAIEERAFTLEQLAEQVQSTFREVAVAKGLRLHIDIAKSDVAAWRGDPLRIRQVLSNLLSNALKFTEKGGVTLLIAPTASGVRFQVIDTGIGLSASQLPQLFHKFAQVDASTTRRYGGTGLGLSISRQLVELMGGTITVVSEMGEGSTFTVHLPLRPAANAATSWPAEPAPAPAPQALRILAAEDNPTNQLVLRALLEPLGAELTVATNGQEAVEANALAPFDIILMDVQMPQMNGLEATQAIRAREAEQGLPRTPILALTANVMSHQVQSYLDAGMDGHIGKPIDALAMYAALEAALTPEADGLALPRSSIT